MSISAYLKRKRDAEERLRRRPFYSGIGGVVTDPNDYSGGGDGLPGEDVSETEPTEPTEPTEKTELTYKRFTKEYTGTQWEVNHNLGLDPIIQVWVYEAGALEFGAQAFGASYFGGRDIDIKLNTTLTNATIRRINENKIIVEWTGETNGKVVAIA